MQRARYDLRCGVQCLAALLAVAFVFGVFALVAPSPAHAKTERDSIVVLADAYATVPLAELARRYTAHYGKGVRLAFGGDADHTNMIINGEPADVFLVRRDEAMQELKNRGVVDVFSQRSLCADAEHIVQAAVVAGDNMEEARNFVEFLAGREALDIWQKYGCEAI